MTKLAVPCITIVLSLLILQTVTLQTDVRLWREVQNAGHIPLFGIMSVAFFALSVELFGERIQSRLRHYILAFAVTMVAAFATEAAQIPGSRDADLGDFINNVLGGVTFLGLLMASDQHVLSPHGPGIRRALTVTCIVLLAVSLLPLGYWAAAYAKRNHVFPQIVSLDSYWLRGFITTQDARLEIGPRPPGWTTARHARVGMLTLMPAPYPGLWVQEPYPDWSGHEHLCFDVYSELPDRVELALRIHDVHHNDEYEDRFTQVIPILPGINPVCISLEKVRRAPRGRELDLKRVAALFLFGAEPGRSYSIYLDEIYLQ